MYLRHTNYDDLDVESGELFGTYRENSLAESSDGGLYQFGDIQLQFDESIKTYVPTSGIRSSDENLKLITDLFGTTNTFSLVKSNEKVLEFEQYIPEKLSVDILNAVAIQGSGTESIERNNFEIEWNRDQLNSNGIVAYMWWNGDRADLSANEQGKGEIVNRAVKLDDTGQGKISGDLFEDIPKNGIVALFFIRGNVDIKEFRGDSYRFWSASQDKHNLILLD